MEEGQTVPADVRIICDYSHPEDFERYIQLKEADKFHDDGPDDPENPQNWSTVYRWCVTGILGLLALNVFVHSTGISVCADIPTETWPDLSRHPRHLPP